MSGTLNRNPAGEGPAFPLDAERSWASLVLAPYSGGITPHRFSFMPVSYDILSNLSLTKHNLSPLPARLTHSAALASPRHSRNHFMFFGPSVVLVQRFHSAPYLPFAL